MLFLCKDKEDGDGGRRTDHYNHLLDTNYNISQWEEERLMYKDKKWLRKRQSILRRDNYLCRECTRYGKTTQANTVHHVKSAEDSPELYLADKNLYSCCGSCHNTFHDRVTNELTDKGLKLVDRIYK